MAYVQVITEKPHTFTISIKTEGVGKTEGLSALLKFTLPRNYPEVPPVIVVEEDNLEEQVKFMIKMKMEQVAEENLGLPMIFSIFSESIEILKEKNQEVIDDIERKRAIEKKEKLDIKKINLKSFVSLKADLDDESDSDDPDWRP